MKKFAKIIETKVNLPILLISILIFKIFIFLVLPHEAGELYQVTGGSPTPDTSFLYTSTDLYAMAENFGEAGREYYIRTRFSFDLVWPIVYTSFLLSSFAMLLRSMEFIPKIVYLFPTLGFFFDLVENTSAALVFYCYPQKLNVLARITPLATFSKWVTIGISFLLLLVFTYLKVKTRLAEAKR